MFRHPNYYKELRKRNKLDQAISSRKTVDVGDSVRLGPGLKQQASGNKQQAPSTKVQASSHKLQSPRLLTLEKVSRHPNRGALLR